MSNSYLDRNDDPIVDLLASGYPPESATGESGHPTGGSGNNDDEIQVISRDDYHNPFEDQFPSSGHTPSIPTPSITHNQLFPQDDFIDHPHDGRYQQPTGHTPLFRDDEVPVQADGPSAAGVQPQVHAPRAAPGMSPLFAPNELIQQRSSSPPGKAQPGNTVSTMVQAPKFSAPLPPLPPLSESVIPSGLSLQAFNSVSEDLKSALPSNANLISNTTSGNKRKKENTAPKTRPAFVMKIWSMVNDPANKDYIRWNDDGKTFQVFHREEFMKAILPKYFKHNNFASFVRQLNMYGWHKVQDINSGTMNQGKDEKNADEIWQFENPNFIRDREDLLDKIVRNKSVNQTETESGDSSQVNFQMLLNELDQIKLHQLAITEDLRRVRKDNKTLWQENYNTRERHQQQARTLDKILKFLAAVYGNNAGKIMELENGGFTDNGHMTTYNYNNQAGADGGPPTPNPYGPQGNGTVPTPFQKPRLMLTNQAHRRSPQTDGTRSPRQHRPSNTTSDTGTIEEIIRSYGNTPNSNTPNQGDAAASNSANRIYQQLIHDPGAAPSPRHYFPELNTSNNYSGPSSGAPPGPVPGPATPGQFIRMGNTPGAEVPSDLMSGLEQNIYKQGQSIQQVQDWIQKLANQQQQQQATINEINEDLKPDLDEFDVNEFLNNSKASGDGGFTSRESTTAENSSANTDATGTPVGKRGADDIFWANEDGPPARKRAQPPPANE